MNETQFIKLNQEILYKIQNINDINETADFYEKLRKLKKYIYENPNNESVKQFITILLNYYINLFFKKELVDAFYIPEQYHYYKQIQIYANLPFTLNPSYGDYLSKLFVTPSEVYRSLYETFLWILGQYRPDIAVSSHIQAVSDFVHQNENIIYSPKDDYYNLEKEIALYNNASKGFQFKELKEFGWTQKTMNQEEIRRKFINKRKGNIGEIYVYRVIQNFNLNYFVSKDVGNGFGYDIYFFDNGIENLVEIKTTSTLSEDDYFNISENEYNVMKNCFHNPCAKYSICRVELNSSLIPTSYTLLTMKDEETLTNPDGEIEYNLCQISNGEFYFRKQKQKQKSIGTLI